LVNHGLNRDTNIAIIERGTLPDQKIIVGKSSNIIKKMKKSSIKPPAVVVIGDVVSLSKKLSWR
jgi:siroheme synthase